MRANVAKAVSHPLRMRMLMLLTSRVASPSEMAEEFDQPLNHTSYHMKRLVDLGCAELVRTEPRRGAVEHYYRALERPMLSEEDLELLPLAVRRGLVDAVLSQIAQDVGAAAVDDGFERPGAVAERMSMTLDEEGWSELGEALEDAMHRFIEIQAEVANRAVAENSDTFRANVSLMLFETP